MASSHLQGFVRPVVCVTNPTHLRNIGPSQIFLVGMIASYVDKQDINTLYSWTWTDNFDDGKYIIRPNDVPDTAYGRWVKKSENSRIPEPMVFMLDGPFGYANTPGTFGAVMVATGPQRSVSSVWMTRRRQGLSGTTRATILVNGSNIFASPTLEPSISAVDPDHTSTQSNITDPPVVLTNGDLVEVLLQEAEAPREELDSTGKLIEGPEGLCVVVAFHPTSV